MNKPKYHIFVCTSSRINGQQKGYCHSKGAVDLVEIFREEIEDLGLEGEVFVSNTGCFGLCEKGPIVVVYPDNVWYGPVTPDNALLIVSEHIAGGNIVKDLVLD